MKLLWPTCVLNYKRPIPFCSLFMTFSTSYLLRMQYKVKYEYDLVNSCVAILVQKFFELMAYIIHNLYGSILLELSYWMCVMLFHGSWDTQGILSNLLGIKRRSNFSKVNLLGLIFLDKKQTEEERFSWIHLM